MATFAADWEHDSAADLSSVVVAQPPSLSIAQALKRKLVASPPPSKRAKLSATTHVVVPATVSMPTSPPQKRKADDRPTARRASVDTEPQDTLKRHRREACDAVRSPPRGGERGRCSVGLDALDGALQAWTLRTSTATAAAPAPALKGQLAAKAQRRLQGARFRMLNEMLYTSTGSHAFKLFQANPELFSVYHEGFKTQVEHWPVNPVRTMIEHVRRLPRKLIIADFGCGEAELAASVPHTVHSFDLVAHNARVTPCDIAHVPLGACSVDVGVFCLALMGTDFCAFLQEAHRVLRPYGRLLVAEVRSRIPDLALFLDLVAAVGFEVVAKDESNVMFVRLEFRKGAGATGIIDRDASTKLLQPCIYKRR